MPIVDQRSILTYDFKNYLDGIDVVCLCCFSKSFNVNLNHVCTPGLTSLTSVNYFRSSNFYNYILLISGINGKMQLVKL